MNTFEERTRERLELLRIIGDLERELESARSLAVDRDQRLAEIARLATPPYGVGSYHYLIEQLRRIAQGENA